MQTALSLTANLPKNSLEMYLSVYFENKYLEEIRSSEANSQSKDPAPNLFERREIQ